MFNNFNISRFNVLDSTNLFVKENNSDMLSGTIVVADVQTAGKGRFNRSWVSDSGGLWFSILLKHQTPEKSFMFGFAVGVCVCRAANALGIAADVKWPNDVLVDGKKLCGILSENIICGDSVSTIVGVGININNSIPLESATTLSEELGRGIDTQDFLKSVLNLFKEYLRSIESNKAGHVLSDWNSYWGGKGDSVCVKTLSGDIVGIAEAIDSDGCLVVRSADNSQSIVSEGDLV